MVQVKIQKEGLSLTAVLQGQPARRLRCGQRGGGNPGPRANPASSAVLICKNSAERTCSAQRLLVTRTMGVSLAQCQQKLDHSDGKVTGKRKLE